MPKILIVEDEADQMNLFRDFFKREGWEVIGAVNGAGALKAAFEKLPNVILLNVNLPDMDGFEICKRIKTNPETAMVPLILISGNKKDTESIVKGLDLGSATYLIKPVDLDVLKAKLEAVLKLKG